MVASDQVCAVHDRLIPVSTLPPNLLSCQEGTCVSSFL